MNSSRWIGEDRNSKDCQTDGEFTFFCCFISVSLDLDAMQPYTWKWALGPPAPQKRESSRRRELSHESGRELIMLRESAETLFFVLFRSVFPSLCFVILQLPSIPVVVIMGATAGANKS